MTQQRPRSRIPRPRLPRRRPGTLALMVGVTLGMGVFTVLVGVLLISWRDDPVGLDRWTLVEVGARAPFLPTLANADAGAGANRLSFTIQDERGQIRGDLTVRVAIYDLATDPDTPVAAQFAQFISYACGVAPARAAPARHRREPVRQRPLRRGGHLRRAGLLPAPRHLGPGVPDRPQRRPLRRGGPGGGAVPAVRARPPRRAGRRAGGAGDALPHPGGRARSGGA